MQSDKEILRPLVERIAELAARPGELAKKRMWADHQGLRKTDKIPVCVYYEGIPPETWRPMLGENCLQCADKLARAVEYDLRRRIWMADNVPDDHIVWPAVWAGAAVTREASWGVELGRRHSGQSLGAYQIVAPLADGLDLSRVRFADQEIDDRQTADNAAKAADLTGGRLAVFVNYPTLGHSPFEVLIAMRGMEQAMMDAIERPEEVVALMEVITAAYEAHHADRERRGHVNRWEIDGFSAFGIRVHCFRRGIGVPLTGTRGQDARATVARLSDEWAYVSAQSSAGFGPAMFQRFVQPSNERMAAPFVNRTVYFHGCECLDAKLDSIARIPNLRRLHVSPWSSVAAAVRKFAGSVVMEVHAHPGNVVFGGTAESMRAELRGLIGQAEGFPLDLNLSDIHSVNDSPATLGLWARVAQELSR